jgi:hypothetical protein
MGSGRSTPTRFSPHDRQLDGLVDHHRAETVDLGGQLGQLRRLRRRHLGLPGRDACKAAIAPSRATWRSRAITVRSTPASAAAWAWVTWPVSIRTHKSYFCSAVRNRFGFLIDTGLVLHGEGQQPSQMRSEDPRILLHEVRSKARCGPTPERSTSLSRP